MFTKNDAGVYTTADGRWELERRFRPSKRRPECSTPDGWWLIDTDTQAVCIVRDLSDAKATVNDTLARAARARQGLTVAEVIDSLTDDEPPAAALEPPLDPDR